MNPIDIVPKDPQLYDDRFTDMSVSIIANHVYSVEDSAAIYATGSSMNPLIRPQPQGGREMPQIGKQAHVQVRVKCVCVCGCVGVWVCGYMCVCMCIVSVCTW